MSNLTCRLTSRLTSRVTGRPQHGADAGKKNRDCHTPLDLVKEADQEVADLLLGDAALLDAAKKGNLARLQRLLTADNINCRDSQGRNSTPLHLAGRYGMTALGTCGIRLVWCF